MSRGFELRSRAIPTPSIAQGRDPRDSPPGCGGGVQIWLCVFVVFGVTAYGKSIKVPHICDLIREPRLMLPVNIRVFNSPIQQHHIARFEMPACNPIELIGISRGVWRNVLTSMVKNIDFAKIRFLRKSLHDLENIALFCNLRERFPFIPANKIHKNCCAISFGPFTFQSVDTHLPFDVYHYPSSFSFDNSFSVQKCGVRGSPRLVALPHYGKSRQDNRPSGDSFRPPEEFVPPWQVISCACAFLYAGFLLFCRRDQSGAVFCAVMLILFGGAMLLVGHERYESDPD
jgi:hypothetical protein